MAASPSPTVRRKRLGIELRQLREQARLTCEDVGQRLDCSGTRISRMETGRISVRPGDVRELLEIYGVLGEEADALVQLAREARRKGWWHTYGRVLPTWFEPYVGLESEAAALRDFQCMVVPGLLQTKEYARARSPFWNSRRPQTPPSSTWSTLPAVFSWRMRTRSGTIQ